MQNSVLQRVIEIVRFTGLSDLKFTQAIDYPYSTYNNMIKRGSAPSLALIEKIICSFESINSEWLITGKGDMIKPEVSHVVSNDSTSGNPYYAVDFIGGFSSMFNDQTIVPAYYIDYKPFNEANVMYVNLTGDSMKPELSHGDVIAIKEATTQLEYLPYGEIYAIVTDDFRTVKRISRSDKDGFIKLIPTNKQGGYVEQDIPIKMIRKIFHVLGSIKNL